MTSREHNFMLALFAKQIQSIEILLRILESRGLIEHDDIQAFEFAVTEDDSSNEALLRQAKERYLSAAKLFGVVTGLETP